MLFHEIACEDSIQMFNDAEGCALTPYAEEIRTLLADLTACALAGSKCTSVGSRHWLTVPNLATRCTCTALACLCCTAPSAGWAPGLTSRAWHWLGECRHGSVNDKEAASLFGIQLSNDIES